MSSDTAVNLVSVIPNQPYIGSSGLLLVFFLAMLAVVVYFKTDLFLNYRGMKK